MKKYKYTLKEDLVFYNRLFNNKSFFYDYLTIDDGMVVIRKGYSWNGCNFAIDTPQTYRASCIHDALYQYQPISRLNADNLFFDVLLKNRFKFAPLYYLAVRLFGWIYYYN